MYGILCRWRTQWSNRKECKVWCSTVGKNVHPWPEFKPYTLSLPCQSSTSWVTKAAWCKNWALHSFTFITGHCLWQMCAEVKTSTLANALSWWDARLNCPKWRSNVEKYAALVRIWTLDLHLLVPMLNQLRYKGSLTQEPLHGRISCKHSMIPYKSVLCSK